MALWGTKDVVYGQNTDGSVAISGSTVTGTGTTFNTANLIKAGDIIFFPSYICHGVTPHNSDVTRKTFAANMVMIPKNGNVSLEQAVKHGA